jgi:hypothetical protein
VCFGLFPGFDEKSDTLIVVVQIATEKVHLGAGSIFVKIAKEACRTEGD